MKHGETGSPGDAEASHGREPAAACAPAATPIPGLYREVWRHAAGARLRLAAALSLLTASQLVKLSLPWLAAQAINAIQSGGAGGVRAAAKWIVAALAVNACVWLFHGPARVLERGVAVRVRRSVADDLYGRLADAPLPWHDRHHSGDLQHRVDRASQALSGFAQTQFIYLQNVIQLGGPVVALWLLSTVTGTAAVIGFVLVGLVTVRFDRVLMRLAAQETTAERGYTARLLDFVGNIGAVAALRLQAPTRRLLDQRLGGVFAPLGRSIVINEWKWCVVDLSTIALGWALVATYAGSTVAAGGALMIGGLYMVHQYAGQAGGVLCSIAAHYQGIVRIQTDHASAEPIRLAPRAEPPARGDDVPWRSLALHQLGYRHERHDRGGVHGVSLSLARGERVALVGASGSGKSTLLRVIAGLYPAQHGHVSLDDVPRLGRRDAADLATLIPQEAEIFETTLRENLTFGEPVDDAALQQALRASAFDEVLATLPHGLDTWMSERGANLSGGQRQRLALARGLLAARGSSLLLLDEPTSALDPVIEQRVQRRLSEAFAHATIVASVHRLSLLPHFDRVAFMAAGRLVDIGTVDEVAGRQPAFAAMCAGTAAASDEEGRQPAGRAAATAA